MKVSIEGTYLRVIKVIYDKLTANTVPNAKSLSAKILKKTRMPTLTTSTPHSIGTPSHSNQTRKRNKGIQIGKEEVKLSL